MCDPQTYIDVMHVSRDETTRIFSLAATRTEEEEAEAKRLAQEGGVVGGDASQGGKPGGSQSGLTGGPSQVCDIT